jgi:hypothetical protein
MTSPDINKLVGNSTPIDIPQVAVKWLTYALVLHIVALAFSAGSAVFGLLAHVREMSMTCCSTFVAGIAAAVALLAFIFDLAFFYLAKARLNKVQGGSAQIGNAIWLTLAAWVMLFFSGCFYTLGRGCIKKRPRGDDWERQKPAPEPAPRQPDQLRLDAVKAEADRKARQKVSEGGLPAFAENTPLTARIDGDSVYVDDDHDEVPYRDHDARGYGHAGYAQAPVGTRAVDEYYSPTNQPATTYPPHPRQGSVHTSSYGPSTYEPSTYAASPPANAPPPVPSANTQYLAASGPQYGQDRYLNATPVNQYGHTAGGTTYHSAASHSQYPSTYSQYDRRDTHSPPQQQPNVYADPYGGGGLASPYETQPQQTIYNPQAYYANQPARSQDRSYTLGGDGYGGNRLPPLTETTHSAAYTPYPGDSHPAMSSPPPINTNVIAGQLTTSPIKGPRSPRDTGYQRFDDNPPGYDSGPSNVQGNWGKR